MSPHETIHKASFSAMKKAGPEDLTVGSNAIMSSDLKSIQEMILYSCIVKLFKPSGFHEIFEHIINNVDRSQNTLVQS